MGGYGSGRWQTHYAKDLVDESKPLPTTYLRQALNYVADNNVLGPGWPGSLAWKRGDQPSGSIGYLITRGSPFPVVHLRYDITPWGGEKTSYDYAVNVVATTPTYGGRHWWWICPLTKNGRPCQRRVAKLYLPGSGRYFGCRHCYDLTYQSCRDSHKFDALNKLLDMRDFDAVNAMKMLMKRYKDK